MVSEYEQTHGGADVGEAIIVVSGLPRSGTSMTMKMLAEGGIPLVTDGVRAADDSNPEGYYELEKVKELETAPDLSWLNQARGKAVKIISFLLPHLPETLDYRVLFMHRDLHEVIASQNKMLVKRGEPTGADDDRMLTLFADHVKKITQLIATRPCFDIIDIDHHDVLRQPREQATRMNDFLGGGLDVERMAAAVDQRLYRNRAVR
jgi:hypothetical protein